MTRFVDETFQTTFFPTIGVDFKVRTLIIDDHQCKVQIWWVKRIFSHLHKESVWITHRWRQLFNWKKNLSFFRDTAGQERFRVITTTVRRFVFESQQKRKTQSLFFLSFFSQYYRDAAGVLVVYDVTNGESFSRVRRWIDEINKYCDESIAKVLIGNKDDNPSADGNQLEKVVSTADAKQYAQQMNLAFFETSAKDNKNVDEAFYAVTRLALQQRLEARRKGQMNPNHDLSNGHSTTSQTIRIKDGQKVKRKDKKHSSSCCK